MRTIKAVLGIILVPGCLMLPAQSRPAQAQGIPHDWSHQHVVFSKPSSPEALEILEQEPRYQMQQAWRDAAGPAGRFGRGIRRRSAADNEQETSP